MNLCWTEPAVGDLHAIYDYISHDSQTYADAVIADIFDATDLLVSFPLSGRMVPEIEDKQTRELIVGHYRIIYDVQKSTIRILTVLHGARKFPENL